MGRANKGDRVIVYETIYPLSLDVRVFWKMWCSWWFVWISTFPEKKKMERTSNLGSVFLGGDNQPALIAEKAATWSPTQSPSLPYDVPRPFTWLSGHVSREGLDSWAIQASYLFLMITFKCQECFTAPFLLSKELNHCQTSTPAAESYTSASLIDKL